MTTARRVIRVFCAGAVKGLVCSMEKRFQAETGTTVEAEFGPVGTLRERFLSGHHADLLILTAGLARQLAIEGHVDKGSITDIGDIATGLACRRGEARLILRRESDIAIALAAATEIHCADPVLTTGGAHFLEVLRRLGMLESTRGRLRLHPDGHATIRGLAIAKGRDVIGCAQVTEINDDPDVALIGALPPPLDLLTTYSACIPTTTRGADSAKRFALALADPRQTELRSSLGFAAPNIAASTP